MKRIAIVYLLFALVSTGWPADAAAQITLGRGDTFVNVSINGKRTYIVKNDRMDLEVELKGEIELNEEESDVVSISPGGFLEIKEKVGRTRYQLLFEGESGGRLTRNYKVNGRRVDVSEIDREWLADVIARIVRETGVDAERRVGRILARDGVNGVLDEVDLIESSSSKTRYLIHLFEQADMSGGELDRAASLAQSIPSSGDKSRFLMASAENFLTVEGSEDTYFDILRGVPSSGDKTRVLIHLVDEELLAHGGAYALAIDAAGTIPSSGDRSRFLIKAAPEYIDEAREAYFRAVSGIPSSGDKTRVLTSLVENEVLHDREAYMAALEAARSIQSSGDRARFLSAAAPMFVEEASEAYFDAVNGIPSSGDHARVLLRLLEAVELDDMSLAAVLRSAGNISSSGDKTRVLLAASDQVAGRDELVEVYLEVAESIPSSGDQKRALAALLN